MDAAEVAKQLGIAPGAVADATREAARQEAVAADEARYYARQGGVGFHPDDMDREAGD